MSVARPGPWKAAKTALRKAMGPAIAAPLERARDVVSIQSNRFLRGLRDLGHERAVVPLPTSYRLADRQVWFGYYDVTPFDREIRRVLAMAGPKVSRTPQAGEKISVGFFNLDRPGKFHELGETETWCWQQGCRLRWLGVGNGELILFNRLVDGRPGTSLMDPETGAIEQDFPIPFYDVDSAGRYALSLNFARLQASRPGYGYVLENDHGNNELAPDDDGIWLFDLASGNKRLLISLAALASGTTKETPGHVQHYVNHLMFNPSGDRFVFLHLTSGDRDRRARFLAMEREGGGLRVLEEEGAVAHFSWCDDRRLIVTVVCRDGHCEYRQYDALTGDYSRLQRDGLDEDGHPTLAPGGSTILTDTYPDPCGDQHLLLSPESGAAIALGRYYSPPTFRGEWRCDLHPRFSPDGRRVAFDATPSGWRVLYVLAVP